MNPGNKLGLFLHLMLLMWTRGQTPTTETLEVYSGTNVVLSCSAPPDTDLEEVILEWTRSDLEKKDVFMFRDGRPYLSYQDHQFRGRIELKDPSFKSGDLSIILRNTTQQDSGEYGCHVNNPSPIKKRSLYNTPPIKVINLKVLGPETLEVYSGTDVVLSCSAPPDTDLEEVILEWTRSDLKDSNVFMFRDRKPYLSYQDPQFTGRIELKDPSFKSGDLSIILKNTTLQDSGEYGCLFKSLSHNKKRSVYNIPPIKVVNLKVLGGGCRFEAGFGFVASVFISLIFMFF
ncbi:zwei Ig domain protein zig-8-like isoform X3 [Periophthalmus magnuspinnatus]|uniref:zwei Ig domain protein zig-8-like isoform X3 n=1 Tax=Periophthalmus magnuspinnatus TaxID=409849 RepID=UPI002436C25F|nr:zwei Ig domain protein zig-8-like isoform X3 [Periophthalmus magnuspinnatus]